MIEKSKNKSSTAIRALRVLETVAASTVPVSATEVALAVDVDKSTAYRMLVTLSEAGYVLRDEVSKRYRLSYKVVALSRNLLAENEISHLMRQTIVDLSRVTGETVHFSVLEGDETIIVSRVKGTQLVSVDLQIGDSSRLHCTAAGKALLAFQDIRFVERIIGEGLPAVTSGTITDPATLRKQLQMIRSEGYSLDDREFAEDMRSIAVPVFESGGVVNKGIGISGPASRFTDEKLEELKQAMQDAAWSLSEKLGGVAGSF